MEPKKKRSYAEEIGEIAFLDLFSNFKMGVSCGVSYLYPDVESTTVKAP